MKIGDLNGFEFHVPTSGGKAGKGHQVTSTIQVRQDNVIMKSFRFTMADHDSRLDAIRKAKDWVRAKTIANMRSTNEIRARIAEIEKDKRLHYPAAPVQSNAPLALIQVALEAEVNALRWTLGLPNFKRKQP